MHALSSSVWACVDQGALVFLDLRADRYFAIDARSAPPLLARAREGGGSARTLVERGLVDATELAPLDQCAVRSDISGDLLTELDFRSAEIDAQTIQVMGAACLRAALALRRRRLDRTFEMFKRLKQKDAAGRSMTALSAVNLFEAMRPWYPRRRVCLFDSLSLMFFLLALGHRPRLVFGVRARPFSAHCWVEQDGLCLNDAAENCRSFTPIAAA